MNNETRNKLMEAFDGQFMQPEIAKGIELDEYHHDEFGDDWDENSFYGRLSASGYLDCTDWSGPFDTIDEAAEHLIDIYSEMELFYRDVVC